MAAKLLNGLRIYAASLMLAAMASFVLHAVTNADSRAHAAHMSGCSGHGHAHGNAEIAAHPGADAHAPVHEAVHDEAGQLKVPADHHAGLGDGSCCGSACTIAIASAPPGGLPTWLVSGDDLPLADRGGFPTEIGGPKRPPRTTDIA